MGIGQGPWLTTPLQLATATAILANGGTPVVPHMLKAVIDSKTGERRPFQPTTRQAVNFKPQWLELVRDAMVEVTKPGGTAARAGAGAPYTIAAKTGTVQVIGMKAGEKYVEKRIAERHRDHAVFIAYAPAEDPKIALAILVEKRRPWRLHRGADRARSIRLHATRQTAREKTEARRGGVQCGG